MMTMIGLGNLRMKTKKTAVFLIAGMLSLVFPLRTIAEDRPSYRITVTGGGDEVLRDTTITLREAIALMNGELSPEQLTKEERLQVVREGDRPVIRFALPSGEKTIQLQSLLPPIRTPRLVIDGSSDPAYQGDRALYREQAIPAAVVAITPAAGKEIPRGFTIFADGVTVRGLSLYGFNSGHQITITNLTGDIWIGHEFSLVNREMTRPIIPQEGKPVRDVVIENNWLGALPNGQMPPQTSAFGVSVFNGVNTVIRSNGILFHQGSGILTQIRAQGMQVSKNLIVGNGIAGMPDAIRLDGEIARTTLENNLICGNDGAGVFLFKTDGAIAIENNRIQFNSRRLRRAAVYLMGQDHRVKDNFISDQDGSGIAIAGYPSSSGNRLENNTFRNLSGLSIDLVTRQNVGTRDFQMGDGHNPPRDTDNRRLDTGNGGVNSPEFLSPTFYILNGRAVLDGQGDPGNQVTLYQVEQGGQEYGPLNRLIQSTRADDKGRFTFTLDSPQAGQVFTAIAQDPRYGTSEPAANTVLWEPSPQAPKPLALGKPIIPQCLTQTPPPVPPSEPPQPVIIKVPTNIHFALDRSDLSVQSQQVLRQVAQVLRDYPFLVVELQGHTDPRAPLDYNQALGERRAIAARNELIRQGIAPERLTIRSLGENQPIQTGTTKIDHARNRRVEIIFRDLRGLEIQFERQEQDLQIEP